jgi:ATP-binding cassette, subfamily G (WHITE), member 2, SNQ2
MWATTLPEDKRRKRSDENDPNPWHDNRATEQQQQQDGGEAAEARPVSGTWGEIDAGVESHRMAMEDFEALREELTVLSGSRSQRSDQTQPSLFRTITGRSARSVPPRQVKRKWSEGAVSGRQPTRDGTTTDEEGDLEDGDAKEEEFELENFMQAGHFEKRVEGRSAKKVGVVWRNLTVKGVGSTATTVKTLPDAVLGTFGPDLYRFIARFIPQLSFKRHTPMRALINDFSGVVRDGEMMLVLGRPGSGCSTFLKAIANNRETFAEVSGDISYGGIPASKQEKHYRGEVNYNPEDDKHFASLNVWQSLKFPLLNKTKKRDRGEIPIIIDALLRIFGISHTKYTLVGDEYVRGVSGGERKRVSIAETLAAKSSIVCWDNSTRGLDSSTALDYAKSLRIMTDISNRTTFVTLYQAGEGIYELMNKVMVIDSGRCIFQGPAKDAKQYFTDLGYYCPERQTTADFLTSIADPSTRRFREGWEKRAPRTPEELETAFRKSPNYQAVIHDVEGYEKQLHDSGYADAREFEQTTREQKSNKTVSKKSSYTVSFARQVYACTQREFWLIWGDPATLITKFFIIISNGLIVGSLFYGQSLDTSGAFSRGGTLFFSILFLGWLQLSELIKAVSGRAVVARHYDYAFYRPSAVSIARVVADFPMLFAQVTIFTVGRSETSIFGTSYVQHS